MNLFSKIKKKINFFLFRFFFFSIIYFYVFYHLLYNIPFLSSPLPCGSLTSYTLNKLILIASQKAKSFFCFYFSSPIFISSKKTQQFWENKPLVMYLLANKKGKHHTDKKSMKHRNFVI